MKKKGVAIAVIILGMLLSLIYFRYHYRTILLFLIPPVTLEADEEWIPILVYHDFSEKILGKSSLVMGRETFKKQIQFLSENGYHSISIQELVDFVEKGIPLPQKPVLITMDDGYESNYSIAYEILREFNTKATIFMIGHAVGATAYKDTGLNFSSYITLEQGKEMISSGLISIQSHSMDMHQNALGESYRGNKEVRFSATRKNFDKEEEKYIQSFKKDTEQSKKQITEDFGEKWLAYSYPLGQFDDLTEKLLTESGIKVTFSVRYGGNVIKKNHPQSLRVLKRFLVSDKTSEREFKQMLRPARRK